MNTKPQMALVPVSEKPKKASYWLRVSNGYKTVFRALLFVLPLFVIVFMAICAQAFTRNSVFGFGNDLLSVSSFLSSDYQTVYFTYDEGECTVISYRDGVAVVNTQGIEVYSPDGNRLLNRTQAFVSPRAAASAKYLVAFDFGMDTFVVTNGYSVLFEGKTDFPILEAAVADTGHFALITASDTHLSQVLLYDANFNLIQRFSRNSATTAVCISSNGKYVAVCGLTSETGTAQTVTDLYRIGIKEPDFSVRIADTSMALEFTDTRHLAMVTPKGAYVLDTDGEQQAFADFGGATLLSFDINENGCAFLLDTDGVHKASRLLIYDKRGTPICEKNFDAQLDEVALSERQAYMLGGETLSRIFFEKNDADMLAVAAGADGILLTDGEQLRLVYDGKAEYVEFD